MWYYLTSLSRVPCVGNRPDLLEEDRSLLLLIERNDRSPFELRVNLFNKFYGPRVYGHSTHNWSDDGRRKLVHCHLATSQSQIAMSCPIRL